MGSQSQTRLTDYTTSAPFPERSAEAGPPSDSEGLQRDAPTCWVCSPCSPPLPDPQGQRCSSPLGLNNAPGDAERVSPVQPEAPSLDDAEASALGPWEAELSRRGPWHLCNTLSPPPQGLRCVLSPQVLSSARHWPGVSSSPSGHFRPSGRWARGSILPLRPPGPGEAQ